MSSGDTRTGEDLRVINLLPLGQVKKDILKFVGQVLKEKFSYSATIRELLEVPRDAYDSKRRQYNSTKILAYLNEKSSKETTRELALTEVDLYAGRLNFVFGEAELNGRWAIVSLARLYPQFYQLKPNEALLKERAAKEAIHELGHTFGLDHCSITACVMYFSNSIIDTDLKEKNFCSDCQNKLQIEPRGEKKCLG